MIFFVKNFGLETSSNFFPAALGKSNCQNCWLWSIPSKSEKSCPVLDGFRIFHIKNENPNSAQLDFLLACKQSGVEITNCTIEVFLDEYAQSVEKNQFIYGKLSSESLFAMLATRMPKILEYRDIEDETYKTNALKLPVILAGCDSRQENALPLPFSLPLGFPCFEQRAHIMLCVNDDILQQCLALKDNSSQLENINLFYFTKRLAYEDFNGITREQLFRLRTMFKAVIFSAENWAEAAYFISGGTPGICLSPGFKKDLSKYFIPAQSVAEAISLGVLIDRDRKLWEKMAARARLYSRQQFKQFQADLKGLFNAS